MCVCASTRVCVCRYCGSWSLHQDAPEAVCWEILAAQRQRTASCHKPTKPGTSNDKKQNFCLDNCSVREVIGFMKCVLFEFLKRLVLSKYDDDHHHRWFLKGWFTHNQICLASLYIQIIRPLEFLFVCFSAVNVWLLNKDIHSGYTHTVICKCTTVKAQIWVNNAVPAWDGNCPYLHCFCVQTEISERILNK